MKNELCDLLATRHGHFRFESGHHGDLWLDLELLCLKPAGVRKFAIELARLLAEWDIEAVCGPLNEGAFVALMVAAELDALFAYSERFQPADKRGLFPVQYRVPLPLRAKLRGKRVAIVNDVINAGSAVRATYFDLAAFGVQPVAIGTLLTLGSAANEFVRDQGLPLVSIACRANNLWLPAECPLCAEGVPLSEPDHV